MTVSAQDDQVDVPLLRQHLGPDAASERYVVKHLDRIGGEITRANKTIRDLLDLARNRPPQKQPVELRSLVDTTSAMALLPANVVVEVTAPAGFAVEVDPGQFQQVLINLFTNAAQAMSGGGRIWVDGERLPTGETRLRVRDDGLGVPIEARYRIFEALFTTKAKGSGLGLALCRRILEAHGGSIDLEPSERGAVFVLTLNERSSPIG